MNKNFLIAILICIALPLSSSDKARRKESKQTTPATTITTRTRSKTPPPESAQSPASDLRLISTAPSTAARERSRSKTPPPTQASLQEFLPQPANSILEMAGRGVNTETGIHDTHENIRTWSTARLAIQKGDDSAVDLVQQCITLGIAGAVDSTEHVDGVVDHDLLTAAARCGNQEIIAMLLKASVSLNTRSPRGATPVFAAAIRQKHSCVETLLNAKASPHIPYRDKRTALSLLKQQIDDCKTFGPLPSKDLIAALALAQKFPPPVIKVSSQISLKKQFALTAELAAKKAWKLTMFAGLTAADLACSGYKKTRGRKGAPTGVSSISDLSKLTTQPDSDSEDGGFQIVKREVTVTTTATETVIRSTPSTDSQDASSREKRAPEDVD